MSDNPYISKKFIANSLSQEEYVALQYSLLNKTIKIIVNPKFGLFTEQGFPVAITAYPKNLNQNKIANFYAKVIAVDPMVTIDVIPENK